MRHPVSFQWPRPSRALIGSQHPLSDATPIRSQRCHLEREGHAVHPSSSTLVVAPSWVGDMVMSQPLIASLAQQDASRTVDILAPTWTAGLCERLPGCGDVIPSPYTHGDLKLWERRQLGKQLSQRQYQRAYVLPNSLKSALIPWFAGIPKRIGYLGEWRYGLLNTLPPLDKIMRTRLVDRYFDLALSGLPSAPNPVIQARSDTLPALYEHLGLSSAQAPSLVLCPGAEYGPAKRWPSHHFAAVASHYLKKGWAVWILGSKKDDEVAKQICALSEKNVQSAQNTHIIQNAKNLCGQTNLAQAIDLMASATAVVTNDSGLMHVAAALGKPMVALFGSSSAAFTPPLSDQAVITSLDLACSPCFQRECPLGHLDCLEKLLPAQVIEGLSTFQSMI